MSRDLRALCLLVVAISLAAWWTRPVHDEWEPSWRAKLVFRLLKLPGARTERLAIHQDRYCVLSGADNSMVVTGSGTVATKSGGLELHSDGGQTTWLRLEATGSFLVLRNEEKFYTATVPTPALDSRD